MKKQKLPNVLPVQLPYLLCKPIFPKKQTCASCLNQAAIVFFFGVKTTSYMYLLECKNIWAFPAAGPFKNI